MHAQKKGIAGNTFIFIITSIVVLGLIIFGFLMIRSTIGQVSDSEAAHFVQTLKEDIKRVGIQKGTQVKTYDVPNKIGSIVFIDTTNKQALLENDFVKKNPLIKDIVVSGERKNMFIFSKTDTLLTSDYVGEVTLGQFGNQACTGVGKINATFSKLELRMTKRGGGSVFLGEECTGLKYVTFRGPFDPDLVTGENGVPFNVTLSDNKRQLLLRENPALTQAHAPMYFRNGTMNTTVIPLDSSKTLDRIFYGGTVPDGTKILFQIGYEPRGNPFAMPFYGPDGDLDAYYSYSGQYIDEPPLGTAFESLKIKVILVSNNQLDATPVLDWVQISYYD